MIAATALLTPIMLAAEPVRLNVPDQTYDHATQISTFVGGGNGWTPVSQSFTRGDGYRTNDNDSD